MSPKSYNEIRIYKKFDVKMTKKKKCRKKIDIGRRTSKSSRQVELNINENVDEKAKIPK